MRKPKDVTGHKRVLVLNADFTALQMVSWKKAITLTWWNDSYPGEGYEVIDYYSDDFAKATLGRNFAIPAVVKLPKYQKRRDKVAFSRSNVYIRDKMTCQYCGLNDPSMGSLTFDHVVSRAQWNKEKRKGTPTNWGNIVTCCYACNRRKADLSLEKSGLKLKRQPVQPPAAQYILGLKPWHTLESEWELYLTKWYKEILEMRRNAGL